MRRTSASRARSDGRKRNPLRITPTTGTPTKPITPSRPPMPRINFSVSVSVSPGSAPATSQNTTSDATTNTVLAIGATAVITYCRLA